MIAQYDLNSADLSHSDFELLNYILCVSVHVHVNIVILIKNPKIFLANL